MGTNAIIMNYLKVLTSSQIIYGIVIIVIICVFKNSIHKLIERVAKIKLPGGSELETPQNVEEKPKEANNAEINVVEKPLPPGIHIGEEDLIKIKNLFNAEIQKGIIWEFRFLNYFLVPNTKKVLNWLNTYKGGMSKSLYHSLWLTFIQSADQRTTILDVLESHQLIKFSAELIEVTQKGKDFLNWHGPIDI